MHSDTAPAQGPRRPAAFDRGVRRLIAGALLALVGFAGCGSEAPDSVTTDPPERTAGDSTDAAATFIRGDTLLRLELESCRALGGDDIEIVARAPDNTELKLGPTTILVFGPEIELEGRVEQYTVGGDGVVVAVGRASVLDDAATQAALPYEVRVTGCAETTALVVTPTVPPPPTFEADGATATLDVGGELIVIDGVQCDVSDGPTIQLYGRGDRTVEVTASAGVGSVRVTTPEGMWVGTVDSVTLGEIGNATLTGTIASGDGPDTSFVLTVAEFAC